MSLKITITLNSEGEKRHFHSYRLLLLLMKKKITDFIEEEEEEELYLQIQ